MLLLKSHKNVASVFQGIRLPLQLRTYGVHMNLLKLTQICQCNIPDDSQRRSCDRSRVAAVESWYGC